MKSLIAVAIALVSGIAGGAVATRPAERGAAVEVAATCDLEVVRALSARHPDVNQFIVMATRTWTTSRGTVEVAARQGTDNWRCLEGPRAAMFGIAGTRILANRRSGDGTTPAGVFPLGNVKAWDGQAFSMFGNQPNPGVQAKYRNVQNGDCWGATPGASDYGKLVNKPNCPGPDDEWLPRYGDVYSHAAVIGANLDPISGDEPGEPALAAAIFLHRHAYFAAPHTAIAKTTRGCVSLEYKDLVLTLGLINPDLNPHFAIGPRDYLLTTA